MSAGGQRGIDVSGVRPMRLQYASDFVERKRNQLVYQTFASTTGANAYRNQTPNANGYYLGFLEGLKEQYSMSTGVSCTSCAGLPYAKRVSMSFRS